jgi:dTMP kinase
LERDGALVKVFRDPGGPIVSEQIRDILLNPDYDIDPVTELLLFSAARSQLMTENVLPGIEEGAVIILDRFYDSTIAYQGYGRESVALNEIHKINRIASHKREPDLTVYMDISLRDAKKRMAKKKDRMEQAGDHFFKKVIEGFRSLAKQEERFFTVDATKPTDEVHNLIWKKVQTLFSQQ